VVSPSTAGAWCLPDVPALTGVRQACFSSTDGIPHRLAELQRPAVPPMAASRFGEKGLPSHQGARAPRLGCAVAGHESMMQQGGSQETRPRLLWRCRSSDLNAKSPLSRVGLRSFARCNLPRIMQVVTGAEASAMLPVRWPFGMCYLRGQNAPRHLRMISVECPHSSVTTE
jgi:hypothetical protein